VRVVDLGGNSSESARTNISVDPRLFVNLDIENAVNLNEMLWINGSVLDSHGGTHAADLDIDIGGQDSIMRSTSGNFSVLYDTSGLQPGLLTITITATDSGNNTGLNSSEVAVLSSQGMVILIISPLGGSVYRGQIMNIGVDVRANGSFVSGAYVNASFDENEVILSEGLTIYEANYTVPLETELGSKNIMITAVKGNLSANNATTIEVLDEDLQPELGGDGVIGFSSTITINLTFPDESPATNISLIGTIGDKNFTFTEIEPGVYSITYTPGENDTDITIYGPTGVLGTFGIDLRVAGLIDYLNLFKFHIMLIALILAVVVIILRRHFGI
jgi:hypothetical protein